jgi:glycosyltransferase involved in cell wall biosynthesis
MSKIKIVRVVTSENVIPWHMHNTLKRISNDYEVCVVGQNVSVHKNKYPDIEFVDIDINRKINLFSDLKALIMLTKFLFSYKPHIVHSIMPKAGLLTSLAGFFCRVPIRIHTFTGQIWVANKGRLGKFHYYIDSLINTLNTVCLTDSFSQSRFLFENSISYQGKPLPVLGLGSLSGVDIERFHAYIKNNNKYDLRNKYNIDCKTFVFSFIARKTYEKGAYDMLKTFSSINKKYENTKLLFIGPDEDSAVEQLHIDHPELFINVIERGMVSNIEDYIIMSDVLCLPSYREGFGSIIIDAASMGIPAIGSKIDGLIDSISDGETGILFSVGDLNEFEKSMKLLIENNDLLCSLGENAQKRVEKYFSAQYVYQEQNFFYEKYICKKI